MATALLAAPAAAVAADDRYASPGGAGPSGDMQCLQGNPCSIQTAVEDASVADGDRIILLAGPYNLGTNQLVITDDITIEPAAGLPRQLLTSNFAMSGGAISVDNAASGALLRRLLISHGGGDPNPVAISLNGATAERIYVISDGFIACSVASGTIRDSVCFLTANSDATAIGAAGVSIGGVISHQSTLRNVTAISKEPNVPGLGVSAAAGANLAMNALNVIADGPGFDVVANTVGGSTATISLGNSNYPAPSSAGVGASVTPNTISGNQATPPQFTNFAGNVYSQAPSSPTIDAGAIDSLLGALDVDDNPRVVQGRAGCPSALPDIGAYEAPAVVPTYCPPPAGPATSTPAKPKRCKKRKRKSRASVTKKKRCKRKRKKGR